MRKRHKKEEEVTGLFCAGSFFFMVLFECSIFDGQFICHTVHTPEEACCYPFLFTCGLKSFSNPFHCFYVVRHKCRTFYRKTSIYGPENGKRAAFLDLYQAKRLFCNCNEISD